MLDSPACWNGIARPFRLGGRGERRRLPGSRRLGPRDRRSASEAAEERDRLREAVLEVRPGMPPQRRLRELVVEGDAAELSRRQRSVPGLALEPDDLRE